MSSAELSNAEFAFNVSADHRNELSPVAGAARLGLSAEPKTLPPWLFYDEAGSVLFEQITELPEYYLTRTERDLFERHADAIVARFHNPITVVELGAGTATKTGILLAAAVRRQQSVLYQPIDVSPTALDEARTNLEQHCPGVVVHPVVANYITEPIRIARRRSHSVLALYIGSSIGNFSPKEAETLLAKLRAQLCPGDKLVLGTDLAPGEHKRVDALLAAYDDARGVTAAFNCNVLSRLNRELGADFDLESFRHEARWNADESRIEMHLVAAKAMTVNLPEREGASALSVRFAAGESIHTENSNKFTRQRIERLLASARFRVEETLTDERNLFAVTVAEVV